MNGNFEDLLGKNINISSSINLAIHKHTENKPIYLQAEIIA